ncbi:hypothetical protein EYZ11_005410 [Aspergillus tanneri]|uniref:Arrestin C-terminal-like domain-containing protein n=1 Tax=Aspergillus tanneri TaxID=1220188 RepID=A0A4S3JI09_9EURO|nr:hypothetical protein EYZ11_005410 [Aspergillus tanneri]
MQEEIEQKYFTLETMKGLKGSSIIYRFRAVIGRRYIRNLIVEKPLRIVRTLQSDALALIQPSYVEGVWENKLEYSISTPAVALVLGTTVPVEVSLTPLLRSLHIGKVDFELVERQQIVLNPGEPEPLTFKRTFTETVLRDTYLVQETDLLATDDIQERYQFSHLLDLPGCLNACRQDVDELGIQIKHTLNCRIYLHKPDGNSARVYVGLPVVLILSPTVEIDDCSNIKTHVAAMDSPPQYGEYTFDVPYSE